MGAKVKNVEAVTDYADGRHFLRLHRDIILPAEICEAVRQHLSAGRWTEAQSLALEHAPLDAQDEIKLFFGATSERLGSQYHSTKNDRKSSTCTENEGALLANG